MDPGEAGKDVAIQLFAEVFDHVVTFGFAVDEDVDIQFFLDFHALTDVGLHVFDVLRFADGTFTEVAARFADFGSLREGADGSGREKRLLDSGVLFRRARGVGRFAVAHVRGDGFDARFHGFAVDAG